MPTVKWIKIVVDLFDDEKILLIEALPNADSVIVIWFKLLTFAGKQNNGGVFLMGDTVPYNAEMLAAIFRRDLNLVRLALDTFEKFHMIEIVDNVITLPNWGKHQNQDALDKKREKDRERIAAKREAQKALTANVAGQSQDVAEMSRDSRATTCDTSQDVAECRALERRKKKGERRNIIEYLNSKAGTHYKTEIDKTDRCINARMEEGFTVSDFETVIDKKVAEWKGTEMEKYLRPETLFGTKFESYLNAPAPTATGQTAIQPDLDDLDDIF